MQIAYAISDIQKLTFSNGNLLVTPAGGIAGTHALTNLRYINFTDLTLNTTNPLALRNAYAVYPNPGTTNIKINNSDALLGNFYSIIDISGRVVAKGILATASGIDVSKLSKGVYIIRIGNNFKSKFIKE